MPLQVPIATSLRDLFSLKGKVVVVTGGSSSRGIGFAAASGCAEMGANIAITYSSRKEDAEANATSLEKNYSIRSRAYHLDVSDYDATQQFVRDVIADFGHIDAFIANAGTAQPGSILNTSREDWDQMIMSNLNGAAYCAKAVGPHFQERGRGSFVITASMSAHIINVPQEIGSYSAAKAGSLHLAKQLAIEWRGFARVNTVSPGYVATGVTDFMPQDIQAFWKGLIPLERQADPKELKGAFLYLVSDASSYTTGADILVDGGYTVR